jgi:TPR repeat protein
VQLIEKLRNRIAQSLGQLNVAVRVAVILLACLVAGGLIFWLCNELVYFYIARSYAEELADAYDLNRGVTRAILWASFAAIVVLAGFTFSFSKQKRRAGYAGLLALIVGHSLLLGRIDANFRKNGVAEKCYVMTRTSIKTLNRVGIDPETGRECRPLTPQIAEKIEEYRSGHRPTQITSNDPKFFDAITGEPVVWFSKDDKGEIELFDLMGFHPRTGEELTPITRQIAEAWKTQNEKVVRRAAVRVADPDKFGFFDPVSGAAKVWYWRSDSGDYEFYDGPGFHPRAGDQFKIITRDVIADWRQRLELAAAKKRAEQEQQEREARERADHEAQQARDAAERDRLQKQAAMEALQKQQQSANECDRLAANPTDIRKTGEGVPFDLLKRQADQAFEACTKAAQTYPSELRYKYQLGRAAQFKDKKQAFDIFARLVQANYASAFDNLGGMYLYDRKDAATAIQLFKRGSELGDADSMVSLVDLIDKGLIPTPNPEQTKLALLNRAAELGHSGAQKGYELELQKANQARINQATQQQMMQMFGAFIQGVARH